VPKSRIGHCVMTRRRGPAVRWGTRTTVYLTVENGRSGGKLPIGRFGGMPAMKPAICLLSCGFAGSTSGRRIRKLDPGVVNADADGVRGRGGKHECRNDGQRQRETEHTFFLASIRIPPEKFRTSPVTTTDRHLRRPSETCLQPPSE